MPGSCPPRSLWSQLFYIWGGPFPSLNISYDQRLSLEIKGVIHLSLRSDQSLSGGPGLPTPHLTPTSCSRTVPKFDPRLHQSTFCSLVMVATPFILGVGLLSLCLEELQEELGWIRSNPFGFFPWENSLGARDTCLLHKQTHSKCLACGFIIVYF